MKKSKMKLSVRELKIQEVGIIVDYFKNAKDSFLKEMGADKNKLPTRDEWVDKLESDFNKSYYEKDFYYIIWLQNNQAVGHSNINHIEFGNTATMHLHLWDTATRRKGLGLDFLKMTVPYYFKNFELQKLICEPYSKNIAPNKVLKKLGFEFVRTYETTPGQINFHQTVNRYELSKEQL